MKMNVIFIPYCNLATSGLSLLKKLLAYAWEPGAAHVHERKHLSTDREWEGNDEKHEERHFCYEQQEDLCANMLAAFFGSVEGRF